MTPSLDDFIEAAWQARREGRRDDAERMLREAMEQARNGGARRQEIRAIGRLAHVLRDRGAREQALPLNQRAVALSREEGDPLLLAHTIRHLGDVHREAGQLADAAPCYGEALALYRAADAPPALDVANALRSAALLKEAQGDDEGARSVWQEAQRTYEAAGIPEAAAECARHLARRTVRP